ncbi:MAG: NADPH-dependent glutamate synthase [Chloroflexi bacterium]|nr:NADPH-dependent glutamate synthase [Chloroflexota bacterium]
MPKVDFNRVAMLRQEPKTRARNFEEVALGYSLEQAMAEANRCIQCKNKPCMKGCPVEVKIPEFIKAMREGDLPAAARILKERNSLPGICGRVCPQESQCEVVCTLAHKSAQIAIGRLERYVADWERAFHPLGVRLEREPEERITPSGKRVAVVGSGPAGLTAAADLAKRGHDVTIFEALHVAGGVLTYGIPEFRLPKKIVEDEVSYVTSLGVKIELDSVVGRLVDIDELLNDGYHAVFVATGAGLPMFLNISGENLNGIYSANEFLTRVNLMKAYRFPECDTPVKIGKKVAVIGGGNVAMDTARCALRLGAEKVYIVYRRSEEELPARKEEVENAKEEGVQFKFLTVPTRFIGNEKNFVVGMECYETELGEPDASGRRRPIIKPNSDFVMAIDEAIVALGTTPNPLIASSTAGLDVTSHGTVVANDVSGKTVKAKVWAGGDIVTGAATVISAMGAGKRAAAAIDEYLKTL